MKTQLLSSMGSFVLGGSVALVGLLSWTGTTDLQAIKDSVQDYVRESEVQTSTLASDYQIAVESANAEIGDYKEALEQANGNISKLITAYNNAETKHQEELSDLQKEHQQELEQANTKYEEDLTELEYALSDMQTRLDSQYESDMNEVIEKANEQINAANNEVAQAKTDVNDIIDGSHIEDILFGLDELEVNTNGDKTVTDISSIVPSEQE